MIIHIIRNYNDKKFIHTGIMNETIESKVHGTQRRFVGDALRECLENLTGTSRTSSHGVCWRFLLPCATRRSRVPHTSLERMWWCPLWCTSPELSRSTAEVSNLHHSYHSQVQEGQVFSGSKSCSAVACMNRSWIDWTSVALHQW